MSADLGCGRARELFSDHEDGSLHEILSAELGGHLGKCAECRSLRAAFGEVVAALRHQPTVEPAASLADRAASAALAAARLAPRRIASWPRGLRIAAAVALVATGAVLLLAGPNAEAARVARRFADRTGNVLVYVEERRDRVIEDVRILRVVIAAAFLGRLDQVNDRFDDYRRLREQRRAPAGPGSKKDGGKQSNSADGNLVRRCEAWKERART